MDEPSIFTLIIIGINVWISYKGFNDTSFFQRNLFQVDKILAHKEYKRLWMSGFLHVNWMHLIFNMITFYSFGRYLEYELGPIQMLVIYFASLIGGDLLALLVHKNHGRYSAVGASGAVSGIIFAALALFQGIHLEFPFPMPGWLYGILFVVYSIYGIRSRVGNIGHEAHLGGALMGLLTAVLMDPTALQVNLTVILLLAIPSIAFIILLVLRPNILILDNPFGNRRGYETKDDQYHARKLAEQQEIDRILDKVKKNGLHSLTPEEKENLKRFSG